MGSLDEILLPLCPFGADAAGCCIAVGAHRDAARNPRQGGCGARPGGKTPVEARKIAEQSGLQMDVERQYYSANVPAGNVLSQLPPPGTRVRRGWQIRVAESLGPQRVAIPNVVGQSERAAEINIEHRGLNVGAIARLEFPDATPGEVVSQAPPPNASSVSAPKISLLVSEPSQPQSFVMPNF